MIYGYITRPDPTDEAHIEGMMRRAEEDIRLKMQAENPGYTVTYVKATNATVSLAAQRPDTGDDRDYLMIDLDFALAPTKAQTTP